MRKINILKIEQFQDNVPERDFYVNNLKDHLQSHHHYIEKPHKHDFYAVVLFTRGTGTHDIDFNTYEVKPGSLFLLSPGQVHSWELSDKTDGFIFFHAQEFYDKYYGGDKVRKQPFFISSRYAPSILLEKKEVSFVTTLLNRLLFEFKNDLFRREQYLVSLIAQIYIEIDRILLNFGFSDTKHLSTYHLKFQEFEQLVEENFLVEKLPSWYAANLNISPKHLNRIVQAILGKSTSEVISDRIITEAQRMLIYADKNLGEVANALGYEDYSYFSFLFKKKTGKSPSAFLKNIA